MPASDELSDRDLAEIPNRMKAKDYHAFHQFAAHFGHLLFRFYRCRFGLSRHVAEDLAWDCVHDLALDIHQYRGQSPAELKGWVYISARNLLVSHWRRHIAEWQFAIDENLP